MSETLDDRILGSEGGLVVRYVLVAEVVDPDGSESFRFRTSEGMADWTALGLLEWAAADVRIGMNHESDDEGDE